ncbi:hypothetical protein GCM10022403_079210 [Streptomyces coacervatus]|uniref:Uncharacterized protein n=1 Tax=Streptomyces coacervatus TaxID=647381 RepID=A0ABP7J4B3_9ACTN|nr:hypothetical protein [Streptomyces coacervatus]
MSVKADQAQFSFYGATTGEYDLPQEAAADLKRHWQDRQTTIRRLLNNFDDLEDVLNTSAPRPGDRR